MSTEYNDIERRVLAKMHRTDFKHISKEDVCGIASQLFELRPEVAEEIIAKFPEFAALVRSLMPEFKGMLEDAISSDDKSIEQVYAIANKEMDASAERRNQFYEIAGKVHDDLSKCLENPDMTAEEREAILAQEMELMKLASEKDTEISVREAEITALVDKKDTEKRQLNWALMKTASTVIIVSVVFAAGMLGGRLVFGSQKKL